jgi:hypothetical protein
MAANRNLHPGPFAGRVLPLDVPRSAPSSGIPATLACSRYKLLTTDHCLVPAGSGGGRRSISVGTAIERAPFFPTARTAKK